MRPTLKTLRVPLFVMLFATSALLGAGCGGEDADTSDTTTAPDGADDTQIADTAEPDTGSPGDATDDDTGEASEDVADTTDAGDADDPDTADVADTTDTTDTTDAVDMTDMTDMTGPEFDCVCDHTLDPDQSQFDLGDVAPGSVVCLVPGDDGTRRGVTRIEGISGTAEAPIIITNCGPDVLTIESTTTSTPLSLSGSHFRVTGAGIDGIEYGLRIGGPQASKAVNFGRADHYEIDHVEIYASGFAGIMAKLDPGKDDCTQNDRRFDPFVMEGVDIHHNWIHDVDGEGIYLGNSSYTGAGAYCANNDSCDWSACDAAGYAVRVQYPHPVRQVRIHHNLVENTDWDGIQVGSADTDCVIHDNVVRNFALDAAPAHSNGIQTGDGSSCDVLRNRIENGTTGLHLAGIGDVVVANNVFTGIAFRGIAPNPKTPCGLPDQNPCDALLAPYDTPDPSSGIKGGAVVVHNTLVFEPGTEDVVRRYGSQHFTSERFDNNLIVTDLDDWVGTRFDGWEYEGNVHVQTVGAANFVDAAGGDLHLTATSPAVDAGIDVSSQGIIDDFDGTARPQGAGFDAGAFELVP